MTFLLCSELFTETSAADLAELVRELGFEGVDLLVRGLPDAEIGGFADALADEGAPVALLSCAGAEPEVVEPWAAWAAEHDCPTLRTGPLPADAPLAPTLQALTYVATTTGVRILLPNHAASAFDSLAQLADALAGGDPSRLAALLAPDQLPRGRQPDLQPWVEAQPLPPLGAVQVANYQWSSEVGQGGQRLWSTRLALATAGLTPWQMWLERLHRDGYDGLFTFGDPHVAAGYPERVHALRDDLRYVRRVWSPGRGNPAALPEPNE